MSILTSVSSVGLYAGCKATGSEDDRTQNSAEVRNE